MGEGKHVRFTVESRGARARAVAFGDGRRAAGAPTASRREATFTLEVNEWNGVSEPRLVLRHAAGRAAPTTRSHRRCTSAPAARAGAESEDERAGACSRCPERRFDPAGGPLPYDMAVAKDPTPRTRTEIAEQPRPLRVGQRRTDSVGAAAPRPAGRGARAAPPTRRQALAAPLA